MSLIFYYMAASFLKTFVRVESNKKAFRFKCSPIHYEICPTYVRCFPRKSESLPISPQAHFLLSVDDKNIDVFAEGKFRVRNHYRAHKLSFWMHLVPTLMKSGYSSSTGNTMDDGNESVSMAVHPLSSAGKEGKENSFPQSPPSIQLLGSPYWDSASFFSSSESDLQL